MIRKSLIALGAAAVLTTGMAATAEAHHKHNKFNIDVNFGGGYGGGYGGYGGGGYYGDYGYDDSCGWQRVKVKQWNYSHTNFWIVKKKVWTCY